jgi:hypothetical protein
MESSPLRLRAECVGEFDSLIDPGMCHGGVAGVERSEAPSRSRTDHEHINPQASSESVVRPNVQILRMNLRTEI